MQTPVPDYLEQILRECSPGDDGKVADYVEQLASADPDLFAIALCTTDGTVYAVGDTEQRFTIQSVSKPFAYALALRDRGLEEVQKRVGVEPSGDAFNEISLEEGSGRPRNPMINVGAITTHALIGGSGATARERWRLTVEGLSAFAGRELDLDDAVFASEQESNFRNLALAAMVRSHGIITDDPSEVLEGYTRQCSLNVDVSDLAVMAMTLASGGRNPLTGEQVVPGWVARQVLSVMTTCGMYDAAGDWLSSVGIPAKSGVSGGILGALPGQVGVGVFSPRLDEYGNSVRGVRTCERLSADMGLHLMELPPAAREAIQTMTRDDSGRHLVDLRGSLRFASSEVVLRRLAQIDADDAQVVLDLADVHTVNDVSRRMLLEGVRRLSQDGHEVVLIDPEQVLPDPDAGDGIRPRVVGDLAELD